MSSYQLNRENQKKSKKQKIDILKKKLLSIN